MKDMTLATLNTVHVTPCRRARPKKIQINFIVRSPFIHQRLKAYAEYSRSPWTSSSSRNWGNRSCQRSRTPQYVSLCFGFSKVVSNSPFFSFSTPHPTSHAASHRFRAITGTLARKRIIHSLKNPFFVQLSDVATDSTSDSCQRSSRQ